MTKAVLQKDTITISKDLLNDFVSEFHKMKKVYEMIDHTLAEKDVEQKHVKSFTKIKDLYHELDN